jgi:hypothetical protein
MPGIRWPVTIACTGWAAYGSIKYQWGVDYGVPLSDHADFDELVETAERVGASEIYCVHGPRVFVDHLRARGFDARPVEGCYQTHLF